MFMFKMCVILLLTCNSLSESIHLRGNFFFKFDIICECSVFNNFFEFLLTFFSRVGHLRYGECWMANNKKGKCQPLNDCTALNRLANRKHMRFADHLLLLRSRCGHVGFAPMVCCENIERSIRSNGSPLKMTDLPTECGRVQLNFGPRPMDLIVGGKEARIFESPWLALLQYIKRTFFI